MTDLATRIAAMKKKAEAATPGPWAYEAHGDTGEYGVGVMFDEQDAIVCGQANPDQHSVAEVVAVEVNGGANAAYIAAASPDLVLAMAARIEELEKTRNKTLDEAYAAADKAWRDCRGDDSPPSEMLEAIRALRTQEPLPQAPFDIADWWPKS